MANKLSLREKLCQGDRQSLAKAITLLESSLPAEQTEAAELLQAIMPMTGKSIRLGISGVPGVGKSTFIEALGLKLIQKGKKVAVLAVDPSSPVSKGSILADKLRMEKLAAEESAFIRPSPSPGGFGGVAPRTRESILLCEASGYDYVIVETIGVGQSEVSVAGMTDVFLLLLLPNAGDEYQGIKKGIAELADIVIVNKAEDTNKIAAEKTRLEQQQALKLTRQEAHWLPPVVLCSSLYGEGMDEVLSQAEKFLQHAKQHNHYAQRRKIQNLEWFEAELNFQLLKMYKSTTQFRKQYDHYVTEVSAMRIPASVAAQKLSSDFFRRLEQL